MYSEQFAILLLIAANNLSSPMPPDPAVAARAPTPSVKTVHLKLDPNLRAYRNPYTGKVVQRRAGPKPALLASAQ